MNAPLTFKGAIEGYVVRELSKNFWRVERSMEWEDVMQEAQCAYLECCRRYPDVVDPPHFMALFKRVWACRFTDLTKKDTNSRTVALCPEDDEVPAQDIMGETDNAGALNLMITEAPSEVRAILSLMLNAPTEILELAAESWKNSGRRLCFGSRWVNKMLGYPEDFDSLGCVRSYFLQ